MIHASAVRTALDYRDRPCGRGEEIGRRIRIVEEREECSRRKWRGRNYSID